MKRFHIDFPKLLPGILVLAVIAALLVALLSRSPSSHPEVPVPEEGDFYYDEQGYLRCSSVPARLGIDVSSHQGEIDWEQVAASGIEFAMVRIVWRGYDQGGVYLDDTARQNLSGARAAGLDVGAYVFSQAINPEEARQEAQMALDFLADIPLDYPLVFDWERVTGDARTAQLTGQEITECTRAFCQAVQQAGYQPAFYFNQDLAANAFDLEKLSEFDFWLAQYRDALSFDYPVAMWQYSCTGSVPGIDGDVDMNLCFADYGAY